MVNSFAPCSWRASSRLSATPTMPNPATNTVDPSRTPATASAVVFTCLSITAKNLPGNSIRWRGIDVNRPPSPAALKAQICMRCLHPPLEGEGRLALSEAKCETGWGDSLTPDTAHRERPSPHPAARFTRVDPPPPGEGEEKLRAQSR